MRYRRLEFDSAAPLLVRGKPLLASGQTYETGETVPVSALGADPRRAEARARSLYSAGRLVHPEDLGVGHYGTTLGPEVRAKLAARVERHLAASR